MTETQGVVRNKGASVCMEYEAWREAAFWFPGFLGRLHYTGMINSFTVGDQCILQALSPF